MATPSTAVCRSCRLRLSVRGQIRLLSSSRSQSSIPPESPNFIDIPPSYQQDLPRPRRPKGILPVPRELFPPQRPDKPSEQYIRNVTPDRLPKNQPDPSAIPELKRYKLKMSEVRKEHLRESLKQLHARKLASHRQVAQESARKQSERKRLIAQAEREDERLTSVSTPQEMIPKSGRITYADPQAVYERKLQNIARTDVFGPRMSEGRRDALHNLYMNARSFITTEAQLMEAIEREFPPDGINPKWATAQDRGTNIWNRGPPPSVARLLEDSKGSKATGGMGLGRAANLDNYALHNKDQERMKKIAEELSGGKM